MTKNAAALKARFGEVSILDYVYAGSPRAMEALGAGHFADPICCACGAHLAHVFMSSAGPLGGDCAATLTGDNSTRSAVRTKLPGILRRMIFGRLSTIEIDPSGEEFVLRGTIRASGYVRESDGTMVGQRTEFLTSVKSAQIARILAIAAIDQSDPGYPMRLLDKTAA